MALALFEFRGARVAPHAAVVVSIDANQVDRSGAGGKGHTARNIMRLAWDVGDVIVLRTESKPVHTHPCVNGKDRVKSASVWRECSAAMTGARRSVPQARGTSVIIG